MAVYEQTTLLRCKDENGNEYLLYPITRLDCVDGAEDLVHYDKDQELTAVQKAQFLKNIGGLCAPVSAQANQFLKVSAVDANGNVTAVETAEVEGGSGDSGLKMITSELLGFVEIDTNTTKTRPLIDLAFYKYQGDPNTDGTIPNDGSIGTSGAATVTTNSGVAYYDNTEGSDPGLILTANANFTVPTDLINNTSSSVYTWIIGVSDYYVRNGASYCRICRSDKDVPSVFYYNARGEFCAKLSQNCTTNSVSSYNSNIVTVQEDTGITFPVSPGDVLAFTCDGSMIRFYINGVEAISMLLSKMTATGITTIGAGDTSNTSSYYFNSLKISKFMLYDRCLTPEELLEVI